MLFCRVKMIDRKEIQNKSAGTGMCAQKEAQYLKNFDASR